MDVITATLIVVTSIILGLGFVVIHSSKDKLNRLYFINIVTIIGWVLTMLYYRMSDETSIIIWTKLLYLSASLIASNFLYFTYIFPKYKEISTKIKLFIFVPNTALALLVLFSDSIIFGAVVNPNGENFLYFGSLYLLYVVYILFYFNFAFYRLASKIKQTKNSIEKTQLIYVLLGYGSSGLISFATNLILPYFGFFELNWVGQVSTVLMAGSATYSIVKHRLFSTKVVVTEILVFGLWIILLIRTLIAENVTDQIFNGVTFVLIFLIGIFLIRSVIKEVNQREKIELLASDLKEANSHLTELNRQKSEFVSFATHQLRAPLTAMKGYASLIIEGDMGEVSPTVKGAIERIYDSSKTLTTIVDDYLNITRIELGTMKYAFETIDLKTLIEDVIAELKPTIDAKGIKFTFTVENNADDYHMAADRDKLKQVITNLVDNSLKYTPSGSVEVSLRFDHKKLKLIFQIKDTGIGISAETLPLLFNKFSRAGNANKVNIKGTGLGLFVAKEMVVAHHGTVRAESEGEGKGTTFIVELEPFAKV